MRALLAAVLMFCVGTAFAAVQARDSVGSVVTLYSTPCVSAGALAQFPRLNAALVKAGRPEFQLAEFRAAGLFYHAKAYEACWAILGGDVLIMDDGGQDNSIFTVPISEFKVQDGL